MEIFIFFKLEVDVCYFIVGILFFVLLFLDGILVFFGCVILIVYVYEYGDVCGFMFNKFLFWDYVVKIIG